MAVGTNPEVTCTSEPPVSSGMELNTLLSALVSSRTREWRSLGIASQYRASPGLLYVKIPQGQLDQMFQNILINAERSVVDTSEKIVVIETSAAGPRALIEITYSCRAGTRCSGGPGLGNWRTLVHRFGGEARFIRPSAETCRLEIELPFLVESPTDATLPQHCSSRTLTTLVIEPDASLRRRLVVELTSRAHRVIPVASTDEGIDLAHRFRFDLALCSSQLIPVEQVERIRRLVGACVVMNTGADVSAFERVLVEAESALMSGVAR